MNQEEIERARFMVLHLKETLRNIESGIDAVLKEGVPTTTYNKRRNSLLSNLERHIGKVEQIKYAVQEHHRMVRGLLREARKMEHKNEDKRGMPV